jgi:prepilin-type N-terminal cleavage/methylation domain-containing protein
MAGADRGFTLVEVSTSVGVLLVVLTAAWLLLTTSNANLNTIDNGSQASEMNRAALASIERDLNHSLLPHEDVSSILMAGSRSVSIMVDDDGDDLPELVTWTVVPSSRALVRVVTQSTETTLQPVSVGDFSGGVTTTQTVLTGVTANVLPPVFTYGIDAKTPYDPEHDGTALLRRVGMVTVHLRNGHPTRDSNVVDRTAVFRILALVINGY